MSQCEQKESEYIEKNRELMKAWKDRYPDAVFVTDGIVDPVTWFAEENGERVMFLLKEAYTKDASQDGSKPDWDLCKYLRGKDKCMKDCFYEEDDKYACERKGYCNKLTLQGTYGNVTAWTRAILNPQAKTEGIEGKSKEDLKRIAVVNIKKADGRPKSITDDLYYHTVKDMDLLRRQIELIQPTTIICGGTYGYLRCIYPELKEIFVGENVDGDNGEAKEKTEGGYAVLKGLNNCTVKVIATRHPSYTRGQGKRCEDVCRLFQEAKKEIEGK